MRLNYLLETLDIIEKEKDNNIEITGITACSESVKEGNLFVAIKGKYFDGHRFIEEAEKAGARAVVMEDSRFARHARIRKIIVADSRRALAILSDRFWHHPSRKLRVIGVTGTNGKTTVTYLLEEVLKTAGKKPGVIGTINYRGGKGPLPAYMTTPAPPRIQSFLNELVEYSFTHCVMEASSHALDQERVAGIDFSGAIFTNLSHDHLDYHLNFRNYFNSKAKLFKNLSSRAYSIINLDDRYGRELMGITGGKVITYGLEEGVNVRAREIGSDLTGTRFLICTSRETLRVETGLVGIHNIRNILAAAAAALGEGINLETAVKGVEKLKNVPGRLERVDKGQPFHVFVDYAHTPDAIYQVLSALKDAAKGKIIIVFGCGGDRDPEKRPLMGKTAQGFADKVILTSDNPRSEEPGEIIAQIRKGIDGRFSRPLVIPDRREAIGQAMSEAREGDLVLIAGKGHETGQIFADRTVPFDDRKVAEDILKNNAHN